MPAHARRPRTSHAMPYYSDLPSTSTYYGSTPSGVSYSSSYLNPGGNYSSHSSLGGYARAPLVPRWVPTGRTYSPLLYTISERGANLHTPTRINSPRRYPLTSTAFSSHTHSQLISRPININTADIDVSRERYRPKPSRPITHVVGLPLISRPTSTDTSNMLPIQPASLTVDADPLMPRVDARAAPVENGGAFGIQRSTIRRGRTVVRLHTIKRKDRESPRKPEESEKASELTLSETEPIIYTAPPIDSESVLIETKDSPPGSNWRQQLSDELTYKDKREKKSPGAKLVEKFLIKEKNDDETTMVREESSNNLDIANADSENNKTYLSVSDLSQSDTSHTNDDPSTPSKPLERRCSQAHLAEQSTLFDDLMREENLSVTALDLTKVGLSDTCMTDTMSSIRFTNMSKSDIDTDYPLQTTRSDHAIYEKRRSLKKIKEQILTRKSMIKKSASGSSIRRLDSIVELSKEPSVLELSAIEEISVPITIQEISNGPQVNTIDKSNVKVCRNIVPLKARVGSVHVVQKLSERVPKREIDFSVTIDNEQHDANHLFEMKSILSKGTGERSQFQIEHNADKNINEKTRTMKAQSNKSCDTSPGSEIEDQCDFWDTIGKRETIYYSKRRQKIQEELEQERKSVFWYPEEEKSSTELPGPYQENSKPIQEEIISASPEKVNRTLDDVQTNNCKLTTDINKPVEDTGQNDVKNYLPEKQSNTNSNCNDNHYNKNETMLLFFTKEAGAVLTGIKNESQLPLASTSNKTESTERSDNRSTASKTSSTKLKEHGSAFEIECGLSKMQDMNSVFISPEFEGYIYEKNKNDKGIQKDKYVFHSETASTDFKINEKKDIDLNQPRYDISSQTPPNCEDIQTKDIKKHYKSEKNLTNSSKKSMDNQTASEEIVRDKIEAEKKKSSRDAIKLPASPVLKRLVKQEAALRPLIATPRPLQKRTPQVINMSSSSESSSEKDSDDEEESDESEDSYESGEFYECEVVAPDGRTSTGSNDSGFDSSAPTSPSGIVCIKKDCDVNCHRKCEKLTANLCGVNQKLLAEALACRTTSRQGGDAASTSNTSAAPQSSQASVDTGLEASTAYGLFRQTGHITPPARTIPRFRKYAMEDFHFLKVLGKGSFGKVLLAELKDTEYYYAVKCLKKDVVLEDDDVECTLIERKVLALGTNHPYLCHLFATFQNDSHLFFVMEYLNGGDLMFHIQQSGRFPEARARFYAAEIVSGLKFLHKKGIVYRDLKLDNILLDFDGHVRIADFGMCKLQIYLDRTADTFCGTPDYMAPEIIKGLKYSQTVDWWSFGVLLYEMLIGQSPFSGCDEDELFWSICNEIPSYPRFLSANSLSILTRLLDKEARTRIGGPECVHGDVREQEFFRPVHWERLEMRALEPPFRPRVRHPLDTQYFDHAFTGERPRLTSVEPHVLRTMDQQPFRGFSYTNPNATDR